MKPALLAMATLVIAGCDVNMVHTGPDEHETQSIELDKSEMARVEIKMGVGELTVDGGSSKLLDADFTYNVASWKPVIRSDSSSFRKQITIEQPRGSHGGSHVNYKWNIHLNDTVPMDVVAHLGAGDARINLGTVSLRSLEMNMGVGEVRVDLRGKPARDYTVSVHGGVGQATIYLPRDVGIIANAQGGIGDINVRGLEKRGGSWINPAHENAPVTIHLDVKGGVGEIRLIAE
jgi:hypothetical protein